MQEAAVSTIPDIKKLSFFSRYKEFLTQPLTILTFVNAFFLLAGLAVFLAGLTNAAIDPVLFHIEWQEGPTNLSDFLYFLAAFIGGLPLFKLAFTGLFTKFDLTAGVMATTATLSAMIYGDHAAAGLVIFMMSVGEMLENFTMARANNALRDLASLVPPTVTVRRGGKEFVVPLQQVVQNDVVLVRTGERLGVDGIVMGGSAAVNQAAITGESMPVDKKSGDEVFAGTLNVAGILEIRVTRLGENTTLGQIVKLVKDAQASQAPVLRLANKYARILVPITFSIALSVYFLTPYLLPDITHTQRLMRAITVLVVVCPCALVLATPTALVASIGNAAKRGMLVKTGAAMEQAGRVDVVAFDKTGTLTRGKPEVVEIVTQSIPTNDLLRMAMAVERLSEHPIGQAIVAFGEKKDLHSDQGAVSDFSVQPGCGVAACVNQSKVVIGNRSMLASCDIHWGDTMREKMEKLEALGQTVVPVAIDGEVAGLIALADTVRPEARDAIARLKSVGIKEVIMITGDNPRAAKHIADQLGIDRFYAEVLPQDKLRIIRGIQAEGKKVAFAGDGVNDAPALAAADVAIAMGLAGTDVALETASIGLMTDDINHLPEIIELSRRSLVVIKQNVIFSMSWNVLSVILASTGLIPPWFGAVMHEISAVPVIANAARLVDFKKNSVQNGTIESAAVSPSTPCG